MTSPTSSQAPTPGPSPEPRTVPVSTGSAGIDDATAERFRRDGVVHLEGAFTDWVDVIRAGVERNMRSPGPYTKEYEPEGSKGYFFGDYCNWARIPEYRDFVLHSHAAELAARLMDSSTARFFHEHVLVKEPQTESRTPWHHDLPYYCIDGTQTVSFWTPLDPVPRPVCLELVVGSHRWGKSFLPKKFVGVDYEREGEALDAMPDIDACRDELEIASFDMAPGDAIAFHFLTVHGASIGVLPKVSRQSVHLRRFAGEQREVSARLAESAPSSSSESQNPRFGQHPWTPSATTTSAISFRTFSPQPTASLRFTTLPPPPRVLLAMLALLPNPNRISSTANIPALAPATNPTTITPILPQQRRSAGCFSYPLGRRERSDPTRQGLKQRYFHSPAPHSLRIQSRRGNSCSRRPWNAPHGLIVGPVRHYLIRGWRPFILRSDGVLRESERGRHPPCRRGDVHGRSGATSSRAALPGAARAFPVRRMDPEWPRR